MFTKKFSKEWIDSYSKLSRRKKFTIIALAFIFLGLYQSLFPYQWIKNFLFTNANSALENEFLVQKDNEVLLPVKAQKLKWEKYHPFIQALGTIEYLEKVAISPKTDGRIEAVMANAGDKVWKGQVLVRLEKLPLLMELNKKEAALEVANTELSLAQREYANAQRDIEIRHRDIQRKEALAKELKAKLAKAQVTFQGKMALHKSGAISTEDWDLEKINLTSAEARYKIGMLDYLDSQVGYRDEDIAREGLKVPKDVSERYQSLVQINTQIFKQRAAAAKARQSAAQVDLKNIQLLLNETEIRSPINGYVALRNKGIGEEVKGGSVSSLDQAILVLVEIDKVYARFHLKESEIKRIYTGMRVDFTVDFYPEKKFTSRLVSINPIVNENTHTVEVRSLIANYDKLLKPGMFARAKIEMGSTEELILIPQEALIPVDKNRGFAFKVAQGIAQKTEVITGTQFDEKISIISGLKAGDEVLLEKIAKLTDKMAVRPIFTEEN